MDSPAIIMGSMRTGDLANTTPSEGTPDVNHVLFISECIAAKGRVLWQDLNLD